MPMFGSYIAEDDLVADGPVEDYTGQTYGPWTAPPSDPGLANVKEALRTALESGQLPAAREKLEFELGVAGACDPVEPNVCNDQPDSDREQQKRCDLSPGGLLQDPDPARTRNLGDPALYVTHQAFQRRPVGGAATDRVDTALLKGWTEDIRPSKKEWAGWGWRHIAAKHGWSEADVRATDEALSTEPQQGATGSATLVYKGPQYIQNGARCERWVVVAPTPGNFTPPEPKAKEIMTSYGRWLG